MKPEHVEEFLSFLRAQMLAAEDHIEVRVAAGMIERDNWATGFRESFPTQGRTITIKLHGGEQVTKGAPIGAPPGWPEGSEH
jgi:hypothetical protein